MNLISTLNIPEIVSFCYFRYKSPGTTVWSSMSMLPRHMSGGHWIGNRKWDTYLNFAIPHHTSHPAARQKLFWAFKGKIHFTDKGISNYKPTKINFQERVCMGYNAGLSPKNRQKSFRKCGTFRVNISAVSREDTATAQIYQKLHYLKWRHICINSPYLLLCQWICAARAVHACWSFSKIYQPGALHLSS